MADLDFNKNIHSLDELDKETICTVIVFIPDGIKSSVTEVNSYLKESFDKTISFIGLGHIDSEGFKTDSANLIVVDHKVSTSDLLEVENFCKPLNTITLSFYMKYEDLSNNDSCFIGKVVPIPKPSMD